MKTVENTINSTKKSVKNSEEWITKVETLLAKRLIRLKDMGHLSITPRNN